MRRTINAVLFLVLFVGSGGAHVAMPHNDYEGCDGKCEQRLEAASLQCLAETIYYEAGNQPIKGEVAVGYVVFNRAKRNHVSICDVVYQSGQFFWTSSEALRRIPKNKEQFEKCEHLARDMLSHPQSFTDPTNGAMAFRRPQDAPFPKRWTMSMKIGGHLFYQLP